MTANYSSSPSTNNLPILTGVVSFKANGETDFRDLGYVDDLSISLSIDKKEKKAARGGLVQTIYTAFIAGAASFKMTLAEVTPANLGLFVLGTVGSANTDGSVDVQMLGSLQPSGYLKFVADNDCGPQYNFTAYVSLGPAGDMGILSLNGDFSTLPIEGTINKDPITGLFPKFNFPSTK